MYANIDLLKKNNFIIILKYILTNYKKILFYLDIFIYTSNIDLDLNNLKDQNDENICEINEVVQLRNLDSIQKNKLSELAFIIEPEFQIISFFLDPYVYEMCYIFVENMLSKEIKHFTILFNETFDFKSLIHNIIFDDFFINTLFDDCFQEKDDYQEFCLIPMFSICIKFFMLAKTLIFDFDCTLYKTNYQLAHLFSHQSKNTRHSNKSIIELHKKVCHFIFTCKSLQATKFLEDDLNLRYIDYSFLKSKIEHIFELKLYFSARFKKMSYFEKQNKIFNFTESIYRSMKYNKISISDFVRFNFNRIKVIKNKLTQFTLFLCFCNMYNRLLGNKNVFKMIRLSIYIWLYFDVIKISNFNIESLTILHNICKTNPVRNLSSNFMNEIYFLEKPYEYSIKYLIMKQYLCFTSNCDSSVFSTLESLLANKISFDYTWLIFRCCIYTKIKIFNL